MELNFFEPFFKSKKEKKIDISILSFIMIGLILVGMIVYSVYSVVSIAILKKSIKTYEAKLNDPSMVAMVKEVDMKEKEITSINLEKSFLQLVDMGINDIDTVTINLLEVISKNVTTDLYLTDIDVNIKEINIQGVGKTRVEIAQFENNIRRTGFFEDIYIENIEKDEETSGYKFKIRFLSKNELYNNSELRNVNDEQRKEPSDETV